MRTSTSSSQCRVLQVVPSLDPGGTEALVIAMSQRMHNAVPVLVCCLDEIGTWAHQLTDVGIEVVALRRSPGFRPSLATRIRSLAKGHRATVVHCHHYSSFVYGALAVWPRRRPRLVYTEHGRLSDDRPSLKRKIANSVLGRIPAAFLAVSADLRLHMLDEGFPANRVGVVHNGIEPGALPSKNQRLEARTALGVEGSPPVLGTVARLDAVKDLPTMIRALSELPEDLAATRLVVIGDGPERSRLSALVDDLGLSRRVHLVGAIDEARSLVPAFDVFVNSSITEGISVTLLEAMAAAVPVVATRVGGTPELVEHESTGLLVPARDPKAIASALDQLIRDRDLRTALGNAGRNRLTSHFTLDRMLASYQSVYEGKSEVSALLPRSPS